MKPYSGRFDFGKLGEIEADNFSGDNEIGYHFGVDHTTMTEKRKVVWLGGDEKGKVKGSIFLSKEPERGEGRLKVIGMFEAYNTPAYEERYLTRREVNIDLRVSINGQQVADGQFFIRNHAWGASYWVPVSIPFSSHILKKGENKLELINKTPHQNDGFSTYALEKVVLEGRKADKRSSYVFSSPDYVREGKEFQIKVCARTKNIPKVDTGDLPITLVESKKDSFYEDMWQYWFKAEDSSTGGEIIFSSAVDKASTFIKGILPKTTNPDALIGVGFETMLMHEMNDMASILLRERLGNYILLNPDGALNDGHHQGRQFWLKWVEFFKDNRIYFSLFPLRIPENTKVNMSLIEEMKQAGGKYYHSYHIHEQGNLVASLPGDITDFQRRKELLQEAVVKPTQYRGSRSGVCLQRKMPPSGGILQDAEATLLGRYVAQTGIDIPIAETYPINMCLLLSSSRGIAKAFRKRAFGAMLAFLWHGGVGQRYGCDRALANRLRVGFFSTYIFGGKQIYPQSEIFRYFQVYSSQSAFLGKDYEKGLNDPDVKALRNALTDLNSYTKLHSLGDPEVKIGVATGNLDGYAGHGPFSNSWGLKAHIQDSTNRGYLLMDVYYPGIGFMDSDQQGKWRKWFSGTPYGQVDLVPIEEETKGLENYELLSFLGWNTMTEEIYRKLFEYVYQGGTLFISIPHFRVDTSPGMKQNLLRDGKLADFLGFDAIERGDVTYGCRVLEEGFGKKEYTFLEKNCGYLHGEEAKIMPEDLFVWNIELKGAEVIAETKEEKAAILLRNKIGSGKVYVLNTYSYPGKSELRPLVRDILKTLSRRSLPEVMIEDAPEVIQSLYREGELIRTYFLSTRWWEDGEVLCTLNIGGARYPFKVEDNKVRVVNVLDGIGVSSKSEWVRFEEFRREGSCMECDVYGWGEVQIEIFAPSGLIKRIELAGKEVTLQANSILTYLSGKENLKLFL